MQLLATVSHARHTSNAYADTIGNSALTAYLQAQETLNSIRSGPSTVTAIDVILPFMLSIALDLVGMKIQSYSKQILGRITASRALGAKFISEIDGVKLKSTTKLYAGVTVRRDFSKTVQAIEAHRLEEAWLSKAEEGVGTLWSGLGAGEVKKVLNGSYKAKGRTPGRSRTVSLVDGAKRYAIHQKLITNTILDEVESRILIEETDDHKYYDALEKDINETFRPIIYNRHILSLDEIGDAYGEYFEQQIWALLFFGENVLALRGPEKIGDSYGVEFFGDRNKDYALTHYLLSKFARGKEYYSKNSSKDFNHFSEIVFMLNEFRKIVRAMKGRERDFGPAKINLME